MQISGVKLQARGGRGNVRLPNIANKEKLTETLSSKSSTNKPIKQKKQTSTNLPQISTVPPSDGSTDGIPQTQAKTFLQIVAELLSLPPNADGSCGKVKVRFNHYNKEFPIYNGVLKWEDIDQEYYLSFAYKGNFIRELLELPKAESSDNVFKRNAEIIYESNQDSVQADRSRIVYLDHDEHFTYYMSCMDGKEYLLQVKEDPATPTESSALNANKLQEITTLNQKISGTDAGKHGTANRAFHLITDELKTLAPNALQTDHAKDLLERRDLEDILYSNG